ncbi:hypothetical protein ESCO_003452 [Escovopsis weberi]|uniref:Uncharacterized protein n=1 Tax=Escovopsis weberi TaxID=150374 RepID=A0A0M8NA86_ESCWE|nr:hypothetical protein ESCO_003452 [Escovopsis weberi]
MRRRRAELRRRSLGVPDFDLDGSLADDGSLGARYPARESRIPGAIARLRINRLRRQAERIHAASSGDETETDRSRQAGEGSAGRRVGPTGEDDEWMGLQRIMHSLAGREEIPDEMWAEVGLIRTLMRQEETN